MRKLIGLLAFIFVIGFTSFAKADDYGVHNKYDFKIGTPAPQLKIRFTPEFVFTNNDNGLRQVITRLGPSLKLQEWVTVGLNGFVVETNGKQDVRAEIQPDLKMKLGPIVLNDRNRLGYRALDTAKDDRIQYANELRANLEPANWLFVPFLAEEVVISQSHGLNQNRATGGVGYKFTEQSKVDVGYMLHSHHEKVPTWNQDHYLYLALSSKF